MLNSRFQSQWLKQRVARVPAINIGDRGFSLAELVMVLALVGVLATLTLPSISFARRSLPDSTNRLASSFKMARAKAMSQTAAYRLRPTGVSATGQHSFTIEQAKKCSEPNPNNWRADGAFAVSDRQLDPDIIFSAALEGNQTRNATSGWSVCFNAQGLANKSLLLTLRNTKDLKFKEIEVFSGGNVHIYDH
jgi:prepilin-type N-terminal cleavage/methylation domain-containing protein